MKLNFDKNIKKKTKKKIINKSYKKTFKGNFLTKFIKKNNLIIGNLGIKSLHYGIINKIQLQTFQKTILKIIKKKIGIVIQKFFLTHPITKKPAEVRMGKGKGEIKDLICKIRAGQLLFEILVLNWKKGIHALTMLKYKLPFASKIIWSKLDYKI